MLALCNALNSPNNIKQIIYTSSTSVFGDLERTIDHTSEAKPSSEKSEILLSAESLLQQTCISNHIKCCILRCSGIYGPHRVPGLKLLKSTLTNFSFKNTYTNMIHVQDIIKLIDQCILFDSSGTYLCTDNSHHSRKDFYQTILQHFQLNHINLSPDNQSVYGKIISNEKTCEILKWQPEFPDHLKWLTSDPSNAHKY